MKKHPFRMFFLRVAGVGIAPTLSGYEPDEVLLLHPAISFSIVLLFLEYFKFF